MVTEYASERKIFLLLAYTGNHAVALICPAYLPLLIFELCHFLNIKEMISHRSLKEIRLFLFHDNIEDYAFCIKKPKKVIIIKHN